MFNRKALLLASSAIVALGFLSGCELDEDTICTSNADCTVEGETCQSIDPVSGEGTCQPEAAATCGADDQCSGNFSCNTSISACYDTCTADAGCKADTTCNTETNACEANVMTYPYVAVISETTNGDDLNDTNTPGPDIDAIELTQGGTVIFAALVEASAQGAGGEGGSDNANASVATITGANNAIPTGGGECDLAEDPNATFWSMGDGTGFAVVSFGAGTVLADGDSIRVWELDNNICDFSTERADNYGVYVGNSNIVTNTISASSAIGGTDWLSLGSSPAGGGLGTFTFAMP